MRHVIHILITATLFSSLSLSCNLLAGSTGLVSLAHAAFFGIGAYSAAILATTYGCGFFTSMFVAVLVAAALSLLISVPSGRLVGDLVAVASLGFQLMMTSVASNWTGLTGGPSGISAIPPPMILGISVQGDSGIFVLAILVLIVALTVSRLLIVSPYGRVLRATREEPSWAEALGKDTARARITVYAISASLAALPGCVFAHFIGFVDPTSFSIMESLLILSMVALGGAGTLAGPIIGAIILVALPEGLRWVGMPAVYAANVRQMIYGAALVLTMLFFQRGIMGKYSFGTTKD